ncbi:MAG: type II CRISPR-associated endonuclease Cas1 [Chitinophagaceae bacterium]|nr:type II CRISPR-associated endonuclease Cas1 [Chitinophagaceae bacterium]MCW5904629.1 type II CRISPR-associated endonuclease Cas1 [Chitinophagaceae bacterium]
MLKRTLCIESPCHLKCANEQLVVSYSHVKGLEDRTDKTVPIEDIGMLVLEHQQITITHYLLDKLIANNVAVITCNNTHHPSGLLMPLESNTLQSERFREQLDATEPLKKQLWQQTIKAKITNQASVLKRWNINHKLLTNLAAGVKSGDSDNREAVASAHYWQNIFPAAWQFFRKREGPPPNNLLNYGYAIIRACMARAITGAGLLPTLGVFHRNRYNAYCLADDMMEPYRPFVDATVREIIDETSHVEILTSEIKNKLLKLPVTDVYIQNEKSPLMIAMQRTAVSLSKCYARKAKKLAFPALDK